MNLTTIKVLSGCLFLFLTTALFAQQGNSNHSSTELILRFDDGVTAQQQQDFLDQYNLVIIDGPTPITEFLLCRIYPHFPILPPGSYTNPLDSINGVIEDIKNTSPIIDGAGKQFDLINPYTSNGKVPEVSHHPLSNCTQTDYSVDVSPPGNNLVKVGIFDTGIAGKAMGNYFKVNFPFLQEHFKLNNPGINFLDPSEFPKDDNGHGTHLSSIIVGEAAGNPNLLRLRAYKTFGASGTGNLFHLINALDEAALKNTRIANFSLSYHTDAEHKSNPDAPLRIAIEEIGNYNGGMLIISSAGNAGLNNDSNTGLVAFPASFPSHNILSVASVSCSGELSTFSNMGAQTVDIAALGEQVPGAYLNQEYYLLSGTSQATGMVSRVAAMLAAHQSIPDIDMIKCAIINGADEQQNLFGKVLSRGYLDAEGALLELQQNCAGSQGGSQGGGPVLTEQIRLANKVETTSINYLVNEEGVQLEILTPQESTADLIIVNALGQLVKQEKLALGIGLTTHLIQLPINQLNELLFIQVQIAGKRQLIKVVR